jgi:hypothetical protein
MVSQSQFAFDSPLIEIPPAIGLDEVRIHRHGLTFYDTAVHQLPRALRKNVAQRKIMGTPRNRKGTFIHETFTTILATWKQRRLNP